MTSTLCNCYLETKEQTDSPMMVKSEDSLRAYQQMKRQNENKNNLFLVQSKDSWDWSLHEVPLFFHSLTDSKSACLRWRQLFSHFGDNIIIKVACRTLCNWFPNTFDPQPPNSFFSLGFCHSLYPSPHPLDIPMSHEGVILFTIAPYQR